MESITKTVVLDNGDKVEFARLDLEDLFSLTDELLASKEAVARQLAQEEKLDRYETMNLVLEIRNGKPSVQELLAHSTSPQGSSSVLRKSLTKKNVPADRQQALIGRVHIPTCIDIARMLILDVQEKPEKVVEAVKEAGEDSPLSPSPSTSGESGPKPKSKKASIANFTNDAGYKDVEDVQEVDLDAICDGKMK